ncbi:alpha/beta hydrolase [Sediminicoccus sp. KRV36]|uniref:alpha/beta hydrolase n=1 Tax=Sediminicoccus sp. KRV36 TaxID=3133721 RepID=UPI00200E089B|nr:alpha/beta hydrolase [Sediminicoccus rosea]UPY38277.1 alpha/beta hydrolase [Sediminicoccus rosea]
MHGIASWLWRWTRRLAYALVAVLLVVIVVRMVDSQTGPALELWHTQIPDDLRAEQINRLDWAGYLAAEQRIFDQVRREVTTQLPLEQRTLENRFFAGSPIHPPGFAQDWNRSFVLEPEGSPRGAVVLVHGLTDAPYSLRHVAELYRAAGFVALGLRVPGHGTVPAGLTVAAWEDWTAATRLALREARRRAGPTAPVHIVGYSNGGALALKHAMDAVEDPSLVQPARVVVISPMVGVSGFARFAGLASLPAMLPRFAKAAWLSILPEFNPFKYNSFPVNAAVQSFRLTQQVQGQARRLSRAGRLEGMAPVLAFQSLMDFTVSTQALVNDFFALLPANGSELVIFDRNRGTKLSFLLRPAFDPAVERIVPDPPRNWRLTVITNRDDTSTEVVARVTPAGATQEEVVPLGLQYPRDVYSLSHIALPFPVTDSLYGLSPEAEAEFGVSLGATAIRGETGVLVMALDSLVRISWNPFFPYMAGRIGQVLPPR